LWHLAPAATFCHPVGVKVKIDRLLAISQARAALTSGRLRELREAHGLSQRELAQALGVDETAVSRWELGNRVPRAEVAERLHGLLRALEEGGP
jgi:DNA-binding transcriptional regulator YiaG